MRPLVVALALLITLEACAGNTVSRENKVDPAPAAPRASTATQAVQRYTLSVEQEFHRATPGTKEGEELVPANYRPITPAPRWSLTIDGHDVTVTSLAGEPRTYTGKETTTSPTERRFTLSEWAGGYLVLRGDEAQLTIFGSGVHVAASERGKLVAGPPAP